MLAGDFSKWTAFGLLRSVRVRCDKFGSVLIHLDLLTSFMGTTDRIINKKFQVRPAAKQVYHRKTGAYMSALYKQTNPFTPIFGKIPAVMAGREVFFAT